MQQLALFDIDILIEDKTISDNTKICRICNKEKYLDDFHLDRGSPYSKCKECFSEYQNTLRKIKKNAPSKPADHRCECCGKITEKWFCDHYPNTDNFRGWVCFECNTASGLVGDSYDGAVKLFNYLFHRKIAKKGA